MQQQQGQGDNSPASSMSSPANIQPQDAQNQLLISEEAEETEELQIEAQQPPLPLGAQQPPPVDLPAFVPEHFIRAATQIGILTEINLNTNPGQLQGALNQIQPDPEVAQPDRREELFNFVYLGNPPYDEDLYIQFTIALGQYIQAVQDVQQGLT